MTQEAKKLKAFARWIRENAHEVDEGWSYKGDFKVDRQLANIYLKTLEE